MVEAVTNSIFGFAAKEFGEGGGRDYGPPYFR